MKNLSEEIIPVETELDAQFERRKRLVEDAIDKFHNYLLACAVGWTHQHQDAEDLMSKLWKTVLVNAGHFPEEKIGNVGILRRKCYQLFCDFYSYRRRRHEYLTDELPEVAVSPSRPEPSTAAEEAEFESSFWAEFPDVGLSDLQKRCLWLSARNGLTIMAISDELGVPKSTVGDWLKLAKLKLQEALKS